MSAHLFLAPAGAGKSGYISQRVREAASHLETTPRVCVAGRQQARAWKQRLAADGGAMGVHVLTIDELYEECLNAAGRSYTLLDEAVQYRLLRAVVDGLDLDHYRKIVARPGFILALQAFVRELKSARVRPEAFLDAVVALGNPPRLRELGAVYAAYQERLREQGWADYVGLGWLAAEALERDDQAAAGWTLLAFDGFDNFTETQVALLQILAGRVRDLVITLTGDPETPVDGAPRRVHRRFHKTRQRLEEALRIEAQPLPGDASLTSPVLARLEAGLFEERSDLHPNEDGAIILIAAPDRAAEVREALRWCKQQVVAGKARLHEVTLVARDVAPYRPFIRQTADEFGVPVRFIEGLPLARNPAVAALLDLLRLVLPRLDSGDAALPRRAVIEAWRSPYFDWEGAYHDQGAEAPIGITAHDAAVLDAVARWERVIGGEGQWREALRALTGRDPDVGDADKEEYGHPPGVPVGDEARELAQKFHRFLERIRPPSGPHLYRDFVGWLEGIVGPDEVDAGSAPARTEPTALNIVSQARAPGGVTAEWDVAALRKLKGVLRGLVWAEEVVDDGEPVTFQRFFEEVLGAVEGVSYQPPATGREEILVANVVQARGVPACAVAVLGLAEGEFPATLSEDPFLRESDRRRLREEHGLALESAVESSEREYFYETATRPWERLLLTRPRLAETGVEWQASPFWEEVVNVINVEPHVLHSDQAVPPARAASWTELLESLVQDAGPMVEEWLPKQQQARWERLEEAARIFGGRYRWRHTPFDGGLAERAQEFGRHFHSGYGWSPSRLETYRMCPHAFFVSHVLGLEPRLEPEEGLDARQLGSIYHQILERVYQAVPEEERTNRESLLAALPAVARQVLDDAPRREGFRATAWWRQTRAEIEENVRRSLERLAELGGDFRPVAFEKRFGRGTALVVAGEKVDGFHSSEDSFRLRGIIDRVDVNANGEIRVIDYKTAGPYGYTKKTLADGEKLQLPLYALAARDALELGEPVDGFYWHVQHAEASDLTLSDFGPEEAIETAVGYAWEAVHGARQGAFEPQPPAGGCPSYCPAVPFCWRYQPRRGG
ncbi:MAG: PD-(D/E)XK nuclease family protein [Candidatus Promineifilaceae bacterium]|nr:PD-(D/E)XK nuclease family protein [Candidatus Promineifilaceae bacterium]